LRAVAHLIIAHARSVETVYVDHVSNQQFARDRWRIAA
jgi:hypothetical protein